MGKSSDGDLEQLFSASERRGLCLHGPFAKSTHEMLRRRLADGNVVRPRHGMYARTSWWDAMPRRQRALCVLRTLQEVHPYWVFCCESAALAFGLPVSNSDMETVHVVTSSRDRTASHKGTRWHVIDGVEPVRECGLLVTPLARTLFDCLRREDFGQALAVADFATRAWPRLTRDGLLRSFDGIEGRFVGRGKADRALLHSDPRSESPGESIARAAMIELGFAIPRLQVEIPRLAEPGRCHRVDFLWTRRDASGVIGEFDGMGKYEDPGMLRGRSPIRALAEEQHREAELSLYGMPIVRMSYKDVMDRDRLCRLLSTYGIPRNEKAPELERRLFPRGVTGAFEFSVAGVPDCLGQVA